ncbi:MAG: putative metal-binding motif-containing protein [Nanoarchaeota archaeon]
MVKKISLALIIMLIIVNVSAQESENCIPEESHLQCFESELVLNSACDVVVSALEKYSGCSSEITIRYNLQGMQCQDELSLRMAKYNGVKWVVLPDSQVFSDGDGTGFVTARINSDGVFAVITNVEGCVPECLQNVYDYPDPVLGGTDITLGACGSLITTEINASAQIDLDLLAPAVFMIKSDLCNGITLEDACPEDYVTSGSFKVGNNECNSEQTYTGLMITSDGIQERSIQTGWVDLCVQNELAYLQKSRDECLIKPYQGGPIISNQNGPFGAIEYCGTEDYAACGAIKQQGDSDGSEFHEAYCCESKLHIKDAIEAIISPLEIGTPFFCEENQIVTGFTYSTKGGDSEELSELHCSKVQRGTVIQKTTKSIDARDYSIGFGDTCRKYGPDYALCGAVATNSHFSDEIGSVLCCQIKENINDCNEGYTNVGSIKVNDNNLNRCESDEPSSIVKDGGQLTSGLVGVCVKDSLLTEFKDAIKIVPEIVIDGNVAPQKCPEEYEAIGRLESSQDDYAQAYFEGASLIDEEFEPVLNKGTVTFCVKENKPHVTFCESPGFENGKCLDEEYCKDTSGQFQCEYTTQVEDALRQYNAFVCDFFGCPSNQYNSIYGSGNFQVCSSSESCGIVSQSIECIDVDIDGYCNDVDCNDNNSGINPIASDVCDGLDNNCDSIIDEDFDLDRDGISTCASVPDCNDNNNSISPSAGEICGNDVDEDCDGEAIECPTCVNGSVDIDVDGYCNDVDCNDNNNTINPGALDACEDGIDQNCDLKDALCAQCLPGTYKSCFPAVEDLTYTHHQLCNTDKIWGSCVPDYETGILPLITTVCVNNAKYSCPRQYGVCAGSKQACMDGEWPGCDYSVLTGYSETETCGDFLDNDCDGSIDEGCTCIEKATMECGSNVGNCAMGMQTCKNTQWAECNVSAGSWPQPELFFDKIDNDCDGSIDEGFDCKQVLGPGNSRTCGESRVAQCSLGKQYCTTQLFDGLTVLGICEGAVNPGIEICDDLDNDCDGSIDEGCYCEAEETRKCGIEVGVCGTGHQECTENEWSECKDVVLPVDEVCDDLDNDCDGSIDEGCPCEGGATSILCSKQEGVCKGEVALCVNGKFEDCKYDDAELPVEKSCSDGLDNDCDGKVDQDDATQCRIKTTTETCSDRTPLKQCVDQGKNSNYCDSFGKIVEQCSICDPNCDSDTVCDIDGRCKQTGGDNIIPTTPGIQPPKVNDGNLPSNEPIKDGWPIGWIIAGILLLIAIIGIAVYFLSFQKKPKNEAPWLLDRQEIKNITQQPLLPSGDIKPAVAGANIGQLENYLLKKINQGHKVSELVELCKKSGWSDSELMKVVDKVKPVADRNEALHKLKVFVLYEMQKGKKEAEIKKMLVNAGWQPSDISNAIYQAETKIEHQATLTPRTSTRSIQKTSEERDYSEKRLKALLKKK